jgi:hypothetical protein
MLGPSGGVKSGANPLPGGREQRKDGLGRPRPWNRRAGQGQGRERERERDRLDWPGAQGALEPEGGPSGRWPFVPGDPGAGLSMYVCTYTSGN